MLIQEETMRLPAHFKIEHELREQLSTRTGQQRCVEGRGELLLILHEVPKAGVARREGIYFWKTHDGRWAQEGGAGLGGVGELLDRYEHIIARHEQALLDATGAADIFVVLRHSGPLGRSSRNLAQALEQALKAEPDDRLLRVFRDRARDVERAADLLHGDARAALDYRQAERLERQGRLLDRIEKHAGRVAFLCGIFLPVIAALAFFGMNPALLQTFQPLLWVVALVALAMAALRLRPVVKRMLDRRAKEAARRVVVPVPQAREGTPMDVSESAE